ncbi:MAG: geranylgeranylglyceryl/heptaprenylglyceryl phosphate synthase [Bacteroidales bacterium]|jgi:phosphoglycerol geranylgeranyltransferase|nr:geranylgeranylglyceryl/heptaprenylglyceryl phosphate synthase [Bacteroidales bacterium]
MIYERILQKYTQGKKQFAVLIDPEKSDRKHLSSLLNEVNKSHVDFILLGGSTGHSGADEVLRALRSQTDSDVVLFPGNASHLTSGVDAVLFLSLLSGRNPEYLIENHIKAVPFLENVEVIPVAYLLIDGGFKSATESVSETEPMGLDDIPKIVNTAKAGELLGHKLVYLEAGSGAKRSISSEIIASVKQVLSVPLIVGGGLRTANDVQRVYEAGADIVVVGNALEESSSLLSELI